MWKHKNFINLQLCATFKHFFDAGTIGSGTVKFRHYSQQEPSTSETWVLNESLSGVLAKTNISFTSNSQDFTSIEAYKITPSEPTPLQANGTKQGVVTLIDFTIDGTSYQAEEGMTWEQWCNSSYNTSNGRYFIGNGLLRYGSGYIRGPLSTSTSTNPHGTDYPQANGVYAEFSESGGVVED